MRILILLIAISLSANACNEQKTTVKQDLYDYDVEERIAELGIELVAGSKPIANYVNAVRAGNLVYMAGKGPKDAEGNYITGKVGQDMEVAEGAAAAKACAISLLAQVKAACGGDIDRLKQVIKLTGFVNSTPDFTDQPKVINGASDFFVEALGDAGRHARAAVSAGALPLGVTVEIEGIFEIE